MILTSLNSQISEVRKKGSNIRAIIVPIKMAWDMQKELHEKGLADSDYMGESFYYDNIPVYPSERTKKIRLF